VFFLFLQYFDTVGWVLKTVSQITYTVSVETLNPAQSINQCWEVTYGCSGHDGHYHYNYTIAFYGTCCVTTCLHLLLDNYCCCYQKPSSYV